jgi:ABC-type polysaccharide/polyol phosphate transport system ATPase subunit
LWALRDVSLTVAPGEAIGLLGSNGSGKSTLLKLMTGVMYPYAGSVQVAGRIGALIEVAGGLHPELTGRQNIFLYGSLLGLRRKEMVNRFDTIVEFAELAEALDRQVKFYSSGMKMRLGFSVAAFLEPDVLLVDEVLAVGDASFQAKCKARMLEVQKSGTTIVFVSHDLASLAALCQRGVWMYEGRVRAEGDINSVVKAYEAEVARTGLPLTHK